MLRLTAHRPRRRFWPKSSSVFTYKTTEPIDVGFSGENLDPNSVNYLEQNFEYKKYQKTAIKELDERRKNDINMPIQAEQLYSSAKRSQASFDNLYDQLNRQGCTERCVLCNVPISWKNTQLLSQFISPWSGRIYERGVTNLCDKAYWKVKDEILRAQDNGLLGRNYRPSEFNSDPNLSSFDYSSSLHNYSKPHQKRKGSYNKINSLQAPAYGKDDIDLHLDSLKEIAYDTPGRYDGIMTEETKNDKMQKGQQFFFSLEKTDEGSEDGAGHFKKKKAMKAKKLSDSDFEYRGKEEADVMPE